MENKQYFTATLYSIEELFKNEKEIEDKGKNFYIPRYQRRYVWSKEQVLKLLMDIKEVLDRRINDNFNDYFIGGVVFCRSSIDGEKISKKSLEVIDGQQRLTTLSLIIAIIYKHLKCRKDLIKDVDIDFLEGYINRLKTLIVKENYVRENGKRKINKEFIIERSDSLKDILSKILEKLIGVNNCEIDMSINDKEDYDDYQLQLSEIVNEIDNFFENIDDNELLDYCDQLLEHTKLVVTKTQDIDTGFLVFEKLNDSGVALEPEDLLKNFLFYSANENEYNLLTEKWEELLSIIKDINPGKSKMQPREFLEDYLIAKGIGIKSKENNALFRKFKEIRKDNFKASLDLLKNLIDVATKYKEFKRDEILKKYLGLINFKLGYKLLISYYISLGEKEFEENKKNVFYNILRLGIVYILAGKVKKLSEIIPSLCYQIINERNKINQKIDELLNNISDEFKRKIELEPLYKKKNLVKLLLSISNYHLEGTKLDGNNISIEHILPQTPNFEQCSYKDINKDNYKNYIHRIGNLTLVDQSWNSSSSNGCFNDKMNILKNQNIYITKTIVKDFLNKGNTKFNKYRTIFNKYFSAQEQWGKEQIEKRSKAFSELLFYILIENHFDLEYFN